MLNIYSPPGAVKCGAGTCEALFGIVSCCGSTRRRCRNSALMQVSVVPELCPNEAPHGALGSEFGLRSMRRDLQRDSYP